MVLLCFGRSRIRTGMLSGLFLTFAGRPFCSTVKTAFPEARQAARLLLVSAKKVTDWVAVP
jgi:hypothetical protein